MKRLSIFVFILIIVLQLSAKDNLHTLWKVEGKQNTVYLMGSIHLLTKDVYPLEDALEKAYGDSRNIVFEINLDSAKTPAAQMQFMNNGLYQNDITLKSQLSDSAYRAAGELCRAAGLPFENVQKMKPWMLALTITSAKLKQLNFDPQYGIDNYFFNKAKQDQKKISSLETVSSQAALLAGLDLQTAEQMIFQTAEQFDTIEMDLQKVVKSWQTGDEKYLEKFLVNEMQKFPVLYNKLLLERNKKWLVKILGYLQGEENYLVIAGSGHFIGEDGLVKMLQRKGFKPVQL